MLPGGQMTQGGFIGNINSNGDTGSYSPIVTISAGTVRLESPMDLSGTAGTGVPGVTQEPTSNLADSTNLAFTLPNGNWSLTLSGGAQSFGTNKDISSELKGAFGGLGSGTLSFGTLSAATAGGVNSNLNQPLLVAVGTNNIASTNPDVYSLSGNRTISVGNIASTNSGIISGSSNLVKTGSGTLSLTGTNNTYTGGTTITSGTLQQGNGNALGNNPYSDVKSGSSNLVKAGTGSLALTGNETFTGGTQIQGGIITMRGGDGMVRLGVGSALLAQNEAAANANDKKTPTSAIQAVTEADQPISRPRSAVKFPPAVFTADNAFSTFALNVSDAAYQLALAALRNNRWPDPGATRTEEFLNAFSYRDPAPGPGEAAAFNHDLGQNPIEAGGDLLRVSYQTAAAGRDRSTPLRLTILVDGSGSMTRADRVATLQAALRALGQLLRAGDTVSLVTFARTPQVRATNLPAERFGEILNILDTLVPDGGTNMEEALKTAYALARQSYDLHAQNRVILLTDGAANLGELDPQALAGIVDQNRLFGIALDAYGVGWDGFDDSTLEALTRKSDGRYAFLNGPADVNAAFAQKLAGALTPAAQDVKLQIEFNPQRVTSYRLMGYNNLRLTEQQFRDNTVSAGELAAAEQGTALYNLALNPQGAGPIGTARARYRDPGTDNFHELTWSIPYNGQPPTFDRATPSLRLAAVAAYFAEFLQQSPFAGDATPRHLLELLRGVPEAFPNDPRPAALDNALTTAAALGGN